MILRSDKVEGFPAEPSNLKPVSGAGVGAGWDRVGPGGARA